MRSTVDIDGTRVTSRRRLLLLSGVLAGTQPPVQGAWGNDDGKPAPLNADSRCERHRWEHR